MSNDMIKTAGGIVTDIVTDAQNASARILARDNLLIQSIFKCSAFEYSILLQALHDVQITGQTKLYYTASQIAALTGVKRGDALYVSLRDAAKGLLNNKIIVRNAKSRAIYGFVLVPTCIYENGRLCIEINKSLLMYLIDIQNPYTSLDVNKLCRLRSRKASRNFDLRLYELLSTKLYLLRDGGCTSFDSYFSLAELKLRTGLVLDVNDELEKTISEYGMSHVALSIAGDMYPAWRDFKRQVLDPAISRINNNMDMHVAYTTSTVGRAHKVEGVTFTVRLNEMRGSPHAQDELKINGDEIAAVRSVMHEGISDADAAKIYDAADGDINKIRAAYSLAKISRGDIHNFTAWMVAAIKNNWAKDSSSASVKNQKKHGEYKNPFCEFAQNTYDFEELEKEITSN